MAKKSTKTTSKAPEEEETYSALVLRINPSEMNSIIGKAPPPRELTSVDIDEDGVEAMVKPVLRSLEAKVSSYYGRAMEVCYKRGITIEGTSQLAVTPEHKVVSLIKKAIATPTRAYAEMALGSSATLSEEGKMVWELVYEVNIDTHAETKGPSMTHADDPHARITLTLGTQETLTSDTRDPANPKRRGKGDPHNRHIRELSAKYMAQDKESGMYIVPVWEAAVNRILWDLYVNTRVANGASKSITPMQMKSLIVKHVKGANRSRKMGEEIAQKLLANPEAEVKNEEASLGGAQHYFL
ncbi:hypothetical protein Ndes2526B_g00004 [Nannochloris sp. 'desiccata']